MVMNSFRQIQSKVDGTWMQTCRLPSPSGHKVMPINDPFLTHDCIRPEVSLTVVQVYVFPRSIFKELF